MISHHYFKSYFFDYCFSTCFLIEHALPVHHRSAGFPLVESQQISISGEGAAMPSSDIKMRAMENTDTDLF
jgi:hypothetical protein